MKRLFVSGLFLLFLAGCGPSHMVVKEPCPDVRGIKPPTGKAALVIGRTTIFGGGINFENYLNKRFIGTTKGHSFFVTLVDPGDHYVTAHGENYAGMLVRFESDKTYYLQNEVRMGVFIARAKLNFTDAQRLYDDMDGKCYFYAKDPSDNVDDLTDQEFEWAKEDWGKDTPINVAPKETIIGK